MELGAGRSSLRKWPRAGQPVHLCLVRPGSRRAHPQRATLACMTDSFGSTERTLIFADFWLQNEACTWSRVPAAVRCASGQGLGSRFICVLSGPWRVRRHGIVLLHQCHDVCDRQSKDCKIRQNICWIWSLAGGSAPAAVHHASGQGPGSSFICALWGQGAGVHTLYPPPRHARQTVRETV